MKKNKNVDLGDGYTNVALFGVDSRDGEHLGEGNRTDCINRCKLELIRQRKSRW